MDFFLYHPIYIYHYVTSTKTAYCSLFFPEFELNLVIVFKDDYIISENFPIVLKRLHGQPGVKVCNRGV